MLLKITLNPSLALAETLYVKTGLAPRTTSYYVEVENLELNLTETERVFIFQQFIEEGEGRVREHVQVWGVVDINFGHMPTTHEQALRCWLDYSGCYYTADLIEVE
jgi:hypothetical protein